jgi:hypothetical protein
MAHLIEPIRKESVDATINKLLAAQKYIVKRLRHAHIRNCCIRKSSFGISAKRINIMLAGKGKPDIIGKSEEKYIEAINMVATLERLIAAIEWIRSQNINKTITVLHCHPSTSSDKNDNSNDLVIGDELDNEIIRCEVSDVVSGSASQNSKEQKDLMSLGCEDRVPEDGIQRFLCVSPEFAKALTSKSRKWIRYHYRYEEIDTKDSTGTIMLKILNSSSVT